MKTTVERFEKVSSVEISIEVPNNFLITSQIRRGPLYHFVSENITDEFFPQPKRRGSIEGTLELVRTKEALIIEKIIEFTEQEAKEKNIIIPTLDFVHMALWTSFSKFPGFFPHDRAILILVKSNKPDSNNNFHVALLDYDRCWNIGSSSLNEEWQAGVYTLFFSQQCFTA